MSRALTGAQEQARDLYLQLRHLQLTEHFQYWELWQKTNAKGFTREVPYPIDWLAERGIPLLLLAEKIRARFGRPMTIRSAFRTPSYNDAVGGEDASLHMVGRALDLEVSGIPAADVHHEILKMDSQNLVPELGGLGLYPDFVHIDTRLRKPNGRIARWP